jgi:hypothetical protein
MATKKKGAKKSGYGYPGTKGSKKGGKQATKKASKKK